MAMVIALQSLNCLPAIHQNAMERDFAWTIVSLIYIWKRECKYERKKCSLNSYHASYWTCCDVIWASSWLAWWYLHGNIRLLVVSSLTANFAKFLFSNKILTASKCFYKYWTGRTPPSPSHIMEKQLAMFETKKPNACTYMTANKHVCTQKTQTKRIKVEVNKH